MRYFEFARSLVGYGEGAMLVVAALLVLHVLDYSKSFGDLCYSLYPCFTLFSAFAHTTNSRALYFWPFTSQLCMDANLPHALPGGNCNCSLGRHLRL